MEYRITLASDRCTALMLRFLVASWWKIPSHVVEFLSRIFACFHIRLYIPWVSLYGSVWSLQGSFYTCISVKLDRFHCAARDQKSRPQQRNVTKYFQQRSWFGEKFVPQTGYLSSKVNKYTAELSFGSPHNTLSWRALFSISFIVFIRQFWNRVRKRDSCST